MINFTDYYILESNGNAEYNNASIGDIAEGLFASAIAAQFINRGAGINEKDIYAVLNKVMKSPSKQIKYSISDSKVKGIKDTLTCKINVPALAAEVLKDIKTYKDKDLLKLNIKNIVSFVNGDRRTILQSKTFSSNGNSDSIDVIADGVGDQKGTKVDVFVIYNGKKTKGSVSLKASSNRIQNFDRGPVFDFDTHVGLLYKNLLNLPVPKIKKEYDRILKTYKDAAANGTYKDRKDPALDAAKLSIVEAISMVSHNIADDLNEALKKKSYKEFLVDMIQNAATKKDNSVSILDITSMKRLRFGDSFKKSIINKSFSSEVLLGKSGGPDKVIIKADGEAVIQLRPVIQTNINKKTGKVKPRVIWTMETLKGLNKYARSKN